jgi:hypothetical protein
MISWIAFGRLLVILDSFFVNVFGRISVYLYWFFVEWVGRI